MPKLIETGGRPRIIQTPEEFDQKVEDYKEHLKKEEKRATWTGLALFLGFCSRKSIDEYLKYDGFSHSVKAAKSFVEQQYEENLHYGGCTGSIFALKNFGWEDKTINDNQSSDGSMSPAKIDIVGVDADTDTE